MPRKRVAAEPPKRARKNAPKRKVSSSVKEKLPKTSDEKLGPFVADDLDEEDDDGPDETATIET
jgi:hypothetical protein